MHHLLQNLDHLSLRAYVATRGAATAAARRAADQRGEGVISAAIAVLIMAFLGALMWVAFKGIFTSASEKTSQNVGSIGG